MSPSTLIAGPGFAETLFPGIDATESRAIPRQRRITRSRTIPRPRQADAMPVRPCSTPHFEDDLERWDGLS